VTPGTTGSSNDTNSTGTTTTLLGITLALKQSFQGEVVAAGKNNRIGPLYVDWMDDPTSCRPGLFPVDAPVAPEPDPQLVHVVIHVPIDQDNHFCVGPDYDPAPLPAALVSLAPMPTTTSMPTPFSPSPMTTPVYAIPGPVKDDPDNSSIESSTTTTHKNRSSTSVSAGFLVAAVITSLLALGVVIVGRRSGSRPARRRRQRRLGSARRGESIVVYPNDENSRSRSSSSSSPKVEGADCHPSILPMESATEKAVVAFSPTPPMIATNLSFSSRSGLVSIESEGGWDSIRSSSKGSSEIAVATDAGSDAVISVDCRAILVGNSVEEGGRRSSSKNRAVQGTLVAC
jgi:hypothetical protein